MSDIIPRHRAVVEPGKLSFADPEKWKKWMRKMAGKWVIVTVEAEQEARMLNQLRYHFGVVCKLISDQTGYTKEEVHEILKAENLSQPYSIGERTVYTVGSTTSLTWKEMEDFDERNRRWAAENLDLSIPERGEVF